MRISLIEFCNIGRIEYVRQSIPYTKSCTVYLIEILLNQHQSQFRLLTNRITKGMKRDGTKKDLWRLYREGRTRSLTRKLIRFTRVFEIRNIHTLHSSFRQIEIDNTRAQTI